jgi:2-oxoisovalerate dehydrogenase E2 component (dihydrolipoyl transacylase)
VEIPSHVAGTVLSINAAVGQVVAVGTPIIHIETDTVVDDAAHKALAPGNLPPTKASPIEQAKPATEPTSAPTAAPGVMAAVTVPTAAITRPAIKPASATDRPIAAPAVRRSAWELGIDLSQMQGSGPAGRISHADLAAHAKANATAVASADSRYALREGTQVIPVIGLRRKIAQKMQEAKRRIPHFSYVEEMDVTELENLRARLNAQYGASRGRLTLLPFLIRAMVLAVREHPAVNARYDDEAGSVTRFDAVHLGLATQTEGGLMVPVIRHVESLDFWACATAVSRTSDAARSGKATREELGGSTITLTSLGALGGIVSTPVINHPEVAIVGTNRIVERPVILGGAVVARKMMNLSSSFDHRVVDGMDAAQFVQHLRTLLECPALLLIE